MGGGKIDDFMKSQSAVGIFETSKIGQTSTGSTAQIS